MLKSLRKILNKPQHDPNGEKSRCWSLKQQADEFLNAGNTEKAIHSYQEVLRLCPEFAECHVNLANALRETGDIPGAKAALLQATLHKPDLVFAHFNLATLCLAQQEFQEAIVHFRQAIALAPSSDPVIENICIALMGCNMHEAIPDLLVNTSHPEKYLILLSQRYQNDQLPDLAKNVLIRASKVAPENSAIYILLGNIENSNGDRQAALLHYQHAMELDPDSVEALNNLGFIYHEQGQSLIALEHFKRALHVKSGSADVLFNIGQVHKSMGNLSEARHFFKASLAANPSHADAACGLGNLHSEQNQPEQARTCYLQAIAINPEHTRALYGMGALNAILQNFSEAIDYLEKVAAIDRNNITAKALLLHQYQHICKWDGFEILQSEIRDALKDAPLNEKSVIPPLIFLPLPGTSPAEQLDIAKRWTAYEFKPLSDLNLSAGTLHTRDKQSPIRIGYLSADFRDHPVSYLMAEVFELHDRSRFHISAYAYDTGSQKNALRHRLEQSFDNFIDISELSLAASAERIYQDRIDILVDLTGHTHNSRSGILALRPAPVQINYLGYPGSLGTDYCDYILADEYVIQENHKQFYAEKPLYLPLCFQANDSQRPRLAIPTRASCNLPDDAIVFCCFNQTVKITPEIFDVWCRLLQDIPDAILWLAASNPLAEKSLRTELNKRQLDNSRLIMAPILPRAEHLARLQCADLFLDTLPFNAGTTCSDALWMGLPVITCSGETFASRMAGSLLHAAGLSELVAHDIEEYFSKIMYLGSSRSRLSELRIHVKNCLARSAIFDTTRFTRDLEAAYISTLN